MKRQVRSYHKIFLILTYAEVFGGPSPTLAELRIRLGNVPKVSFVRICLLLNAFLRSDPSSSEVLDFAAHRTLVQIYFPAQIAIRISELEHTSPPYIVFHRQQLLFMIKEALQHASDDWTLKVTNNALGELFLIANDHMHSEISTDSSDDSFVKLASSLLPIQEAVSGNIRHKLIRSYQMTKVAQSCRALNRTLI